MYHVQGVEFYFIVGQHEVKGSSYLMGVNVDDYRRVFPSLRGIPLNMTLKRIQNSRLAAQLQSTCAQWHIQPSRYLYYSCPHDYVEHIITKGFEGITHGKLAKLILLTCFNKIM